MDWLIHLLMAALLGGAAFLLVAAILPGFHVRGGLPAAVGIAVVYGVLKAFLQGLLVILTFPLVLVTLGLFIVVINAFLLWLTDKVVRRFRVESTGALVMGSLLLSVLDLILHLAIRGGAIY